MIHHAAFTEPFGHPPANDHANAFDQAVAVLTAADCSALLLEFAPGMVNGIEGIAVRAGLRLLRAASLAEALTLAQGDGVAICILVVDANNAVGAIQALAALPGHPPLLVLQADDSAAACYQAGADDVLDASLVSCALETKLRQAAARQRSAAPAVDDPQERYRTLFEGVDDGVCIIEMLWDGQGAAVDYRFVEVNRAFALQTGLHDAVGHTVLELVPGHDQKWMTLYGEVARTGEPVRYQNESPGAIARWFDVYATRVGGPGSNLVAALFTDISERKRAQMELERLADDLLEANRRKNEFIATLAHELRNPLAPLRNGLPLLRLAGDDPVVRERTLATMGRQLDHMVELVDDLLDVGRITHGQIALKTAEVDLADVVAAAVDAAGPGIEARGHHLAVAVEPALMVRGDATRLVQVLNNLLNNAAKYTAKGGVLRLTARALAGSDGQASALIEVSDNGAGITAQELPAVFDLFNRAGRERFPDQGGLGLGLSLVRKLVELHGGSVSAVSAGAGFGSTFAVRLPLLAAGQPPLAPAPTPAAVADAPGHAHPVRVLVVDDNSDAADTLAELLEMLGHSAQVANSGAAALEAMQDFRPQVVLLDLGMPVMNGYQVAEAIRNNRRFDQPLLAALTGWGGAQDRDQTRAAGFDLHLTKPVDLAAIEKVLAGV